MSAPIGHTCPNIDEIIASASEAEKKMNEAREAFCDLLGHLQGKWSTIESLRKANADLREWGEQQEDRVLSLLDELDIAEKKYSYLEDEISALNDEVKYLKDRFEQ